MRSGKAILAGAIAVVALAGGGAAVLAARDGDDPEPRLGGPSVAVEPPASEQQPTTTAEPDPAPEAEPPSEPAEPESQPAPKARAEPRETRFRRERRKNPAKAGKRFAVPPAQEFSGRGNALIGTVHVKATAVVKWRASGSFGLEFGREAFPITAPSRRGELVIPPFRFEQVRVMATGRWRIVITPQR